MTGVFSNATLRRGLSLIIVVIVLNVVSYWVSGKDASSMKYNDPTKNLFFENKNDPSVSA